MKENAYKVQATTARAFQKTEMSRKSKSTSASVDSAAPAERQLPTQDLSAVVSETLC